MTKFVQPDKWYLVVDCAECGEAIPFAEAPSPEEKPDPFQARKISGLKCPHCGHVGDYAPALMSRRQRPESP
jgi:DNA-directed RNA polymerase subunit RPC12/RpoP